MRKTINRRDRPLALGYVRVSTAEQADSRLGLDAQVEQLEREAEARGWDLEVVADEGFTAKHTRRPGFQAALSRLAQRGRPGAPRDKVDRVARSCWTSCRWSRPRTGRAGS